MDQRPPVKGPAIVRLAGWIILGFSLFGLSPVGIVAGIVMLRYADRIAGKIAGRVAGKPVGTAKPPMIGGAAGSPVDPILTTCPFCRKMNKPNAGKCSHCGYAM